MANSVFLKPCPKVFIQVIWLRVVVKVVLNAKITDPKYLWSRLPKSICETFPSAKLYNLLAWFSRSSSMSKRHPGISLAGL